MKRIKPYNIFLSAIFALIILVPTLDSLFNFSPVKDLFEKRKQVERPEVPESFSQVKSYPRKFEGFFNDNYGFRKTLVSWHSKMMDKVFDESPTSRVVIGKEGWLYFDNNDSLLDAQGRANLSDELLEKGVKSFAKNWQSLKSMGITYLLVIAADKSTIYPEFLPDYIKISDNNHKNHRIDKFIAALKSKYPDFPILDLRRVLLKAKNDEIIYHKTDTHWNKRGAHYGYVEIMKKLQKISNIKNANFNPNLREKFFEKSDKRHVGDISSMMGSEASNVNYDLTPKYKENISEVKASLEEKNKFHRPIKFINSNKNLPSAFIYKDSYFGNLFSLVSEHFSSSFYINEYPCDINLEIVKQYGSNVVIHEFWEGRIEFILKGCKS